MMFLRPTRSQRYAPRKTPGSAMEPRSSCHSAVLRRTSSPAEGTTLEMMVPEKTPLGKVTKS